MAGGRLTGIPCGIFYKYKQGFLLFFIFLPNGCLRDINRVYMWNYYKYKQGVLFQYVSVSAEVPRTRSKRYIFHPGNVQI